MNTNTGNLVQWFLGLLRPGDAIVMGVVVSSALALFWMLPGMIRSGGNMVEINVGERLLGRFSLDEDKFVEARGPLGTTAVRIKGGRVCIESSPCPKGICTHMGHVGREGGVLVCVPNEVLVKVVGDRCDGLDAVSR